MPRFRKKPVEIDARQWDGTDECFQNSLGPFFGEGLRYSLSRTLGTGEIGIPTLEGMITAQVGDWIIKGVKGEFYPCKPDVFAATYEAVE